MCDASWLLPLQALRSLRADVVRLDPSFLVRFAAVEGLGKIVLSNIRTPKVGHYPCMMLRPPNSSVSLRHLMHRKLHESAQGSAFV